MTRCPLRLRTGKPGVSAGDHGPAAFTASRRQARAVGQHHAAFGQQRRALRRPSGPRRQRHGPARAGSAAARRRIKHRVVRHAQPARQIAPQIRLRLAPARGHRALPPSRRVRGRTLSLRRTSAISCSSAATHSVPQGSYSTSAGSCGRELMPQPARIGRQRELRRRIIHHHQVPHAGRRGAAADGAAVQHAAPSGRPARIPPRTPRRRCPRPR